MPNVGPREYDDASGRYYRTFAGDRFWFWPKRNLYASQKGGRLRLLHRQAFGTGGEVVPLDGDWDNFDPANWVSRPKNTGREMPSKHPFQVFDGKRYYLIPENGYYGLRRGATITLMHRAVWEHHNGPIPDGWHVHHLNGDKADNRIENLQALSASEHTQMHSLESHWIGSAANRKQLVEAGERAKAWHASPEGLAWHRQHGKRSWENREWFEKSCVECGEAYKTPYPQRSQYCSRRCKGQAWHRNSR